MATRESLAGDEIPSCNRIQTEILLLKINVSSHYITRLAKIILLPRGYDFLQQDMQCTANKVR